MKKYEMDIISMNGDFVGHYVAAETNASDSEAFDNWKNKQLVHFREVHAIFRQQFPKTPILPTIGNNDVMYHNKLPCKQELENVMYADLLQIWFPEDNLPVGMDYEELKHSFMKGGYYRYNVTGFDLVFLGLNTMFFKEEVCDPVEASEML